MPSKYPGAVDDAESLLTPVDRFSTKPLTTKTRALVLPGDTVIQVESTLEGFADEWGVLSIEDEIIIYQGKTNNTFTGCIRGAFGTQPAGHAVGAPVKALMVSGFIRRLQEAVVAIEQTVGTTGSFNFAAASHEHDGGDITSGRVSPEFLGSGTPDATKYLRGDGSWQHVTPASHEHDASDIASGTLADARLPATVVRTSRQINTGQGLTGGGDLSEDRTLSVQHDSSVQRVAVRKNSGDEVGARRRLNFVEGSNVTISVTDDAVDNEIDVTISASGGGGGSSTFLGLIDTPDSYSGQAQKLVAVKADESGLEFVAGGGGSSSFTGLSDTPDSYSGQGQKLVAVKADESGLEFVSGSSVGGLAYVRPVVAPPPLSQWSILNQGPATIEDFRQGIRIYIPGGSAAGIRGIARPVPSPPYAVIVGFTWHPGFIDGSSVHAGWRESSTDRLAVIRYRRANPMGVRSTKWSGTGGSATATDYTAQTSDQVSSGPLYWFKIEDDGTNRKVHFSTDGYNWVLLHSVARTDYITPDQVVFLLDAGLPNTSAFAAYAWLVSWEVE